MDIDVIEELTHLQEWQKLAGEDYSFDAIFNDSPKKERDWDVDEFITELNERKKRSRPPTPPQKKLSKKGLSVRLHAMDCIYRNEIGTSLSEEEKLEVYGVQQAAKIATSNKLDTPCVATLRLLLLPPYKGGLDDKENIKSKEWMQKWEPKVPKHFPSSFRTSLWEFLCLQTTETFTRLTLKDTDVMLFLQKLIKK
jgi:hypothetical protein